MKSRVNFLKPTLATKEKSWLNTIKCIHNLWLDVFSLSSKQRRKSLKSIVPVIASLTPLKTKSFFYFSLLTHKFLVAISPSLTKLQRESSSILLLQVYSVLLVAWIICAFLACFFLDYFECENCFLRIRCPYTLRCFAFCPYTTNQF